MCVVHKKHMYELEEHKFNLIFLFTDMMILYKKTSLMKCQELLAKEKQIIELQNKNSSLQQTVNKGKILEEG